MDSMDHWIIVNQGSQWHIQEDESLIKIFLSVHTMKPQHGKKKNVHQGCMGTRFPPLFVASHNSQIDNEDVCFIDWPPAASSSNDEPLSQIKI